MNDLLRQPSFFDLPVIKEDFINSNLLEGRIIQIVNGQRISISSEDFVSIHVKPDDNRVYGYSTSIEAPLEGSLEEIKEQFQKRAVLLIPAKLLLPTGGAVENSEEYNLNALKFKLLKDESQPMGYKLQQIRSPNNIYQAMSDDFSKPLSLEALERSSSFKRLEIYSESLAL